MSKVIRDIRDCIGFVLLRSVIGLEISRHLLNQSDAKVKPIATWSLAFPRLRPVTCVYFEFSLALCDIFLGSDWPCDYFGFGFRILNRKALYTSDRSYK